MTTDTKRRDELRKLAEAATPGPWYVFGPVSTGFSSRYFDVNDSKISICQTAGDLEIRYPENIKEQEANSKFIAASRTAIPELLDALDARNAEVAELTKERDLEASNASAFLEGSAEWEESFHQAKALEKAAIEKWQRYQRERDALQAQLAKAREALERTWPVCEECYEPALIQYDSQGEGRYWLCGKDDFDHSDEFWSGKELYRLDRAALAELDGGGK